MAKDLAVILNNGSLNSAVVTSLAVQKYRPVMLHGEIVPAAGSRARAAYDQQVAHFRPYREHTLSMPFLAAIQPASNTPAGVADPRQHAAVAPTAMHLLPLIAAAVRFAAHYQAAAIYLGLRVGASSDDLSTASEYVQVWNEMINLPLGYPDLELQAPLLEIEPWQVVDIGVNVAAPFERSWSCLEDRAEPCGMCRGCRTRELAFQQAGKPDPLKPVKK
jgi:7-cyano-7-deazaguanine synthase in queuosine biosynthesis